MQNLKIGKFDPFGNYYTFLLGVCFDPRLLLRANLEKTTLSICQTKLLWIRGIGVARRYTGCTCTPMAEKKNFGPDWQGKVVSAPSRQTVHPQAEQESILGKLGDLDGGSGNFSSFSLCFEGDDKNGRQLFRGRKVHPQRKLWLRLW